MFPKCYLLAEIKANSTKIIRKFLKVAKKQLIWLLTTIFLTNKKQQLATAGFVLPTVVMVSVVVVLLTASIILRSFNRAQNASNIRINQALLSYAMPAIDRGRAKINQLFNDRSLPRVIPRDQSLYNVINNNIGKYTFGDETPLQITFDINKNNTIDQPTTSTKIYDNETLNTAWRFPIDTNNNGKFDSYNIYGIYFRTPSVNSGGKYTRSRNPLEARTLPMSSGNLSAKCSRNTSTTLVGNTGWVQQNNKFHKSFFIYTAIAPITSTPTDTTNYEKYQGNKAFTAVEYQQDRTQIPPNNHALVYEDDISLTPQANFQLNGAIFTNGNFLTSDIQGGAVRFYQVSSPSSCFYEAHNAKITVGGNIALGGFTSTNSQGNATVDLFKGQDANVGSVFWNNSISNLNTPANIAYNNLAYIRRINQLVNAQISNSESTDPSEVTTGLAAKQQALGITLNEKERTKYRRQQLQIYFKKRTRRVPYTEVAADATETYPSTLLQGSGDTLRPIDNWVYPTDPTDGKTGTGYTNLSLNITGTSLEPKATEPTSLKNSGGVEALLGDRVLLGNNLPQLWWDTTKAAFVSSGINDTQNISGIKWDAGNTDKTRTRRSLVQTLADIGSTDRDGEWELAAAKVPSEPTDGVGGLRVVTGAGVYLRKNDTLSSISTNPPNPILPDTQGMSDDTNTKPYLKMRATAVYHYKSTGYDAQTPKPIACVSSYYDPTDSNSYKNMESLPDAFNLEKPKNSKPNSTSNNGIVYPAPTKTVNDYSTALEYLSKLKYQFSYTVSDYSTALTYLSKLKYQFSYTVSDNKILIERLIDDGLLARALNKPAPDRTISEQSAIDAQICALQIIEGSLLPVSNNPVIPHGAIFETFFSDQREKLFSNDLKTLFPGQQDQKIRATVLDLDLLRGKTIGDSEYLLPNSGIIYATRDDALPDISAGNTDAGKLESPVDYVDDTTRRPSAILLINGEKLWRTNTYKEEEKGLTLATNLPAYIKGDFNLHTQEEFTETLQDGWSNFYGRTPLNNNFACRSGDPRFPDCTTGDEWRPASILADAVTLLSGNFDYFTKELGYTIGNQQLANKDTTFNLIIAAGDNPAKPTQDNGGLNNLVRVIEKWDSRKIKLNGAFMQVKKSAYATGTNSPQTLDNTLTRQWSYDVGLLSQIPDLFASKLMLTPPDLPNEYLREVSRDDAWIQKLLCAKDTTSASNYAIDQDQRPSICQS
ncbi:hypothetical protein H6F32_06195 [Anabaena sp. FACHB-1237]|uniref:hormogonium polysaccharide biosynthesis protein HpsA n=1 Tax=Anabaena sp. FACHB-1237 TaxID=2692769 RepID=UPI0016817476|nr:hormogonium polysaccharide biosynthesis protein HpsA [Anabaena sp. FACHB-1237]MBD2137182.1 hypothetical protein [Anabaena sp. FACHB-1237]